MDLVHRALPAAAPKRHVTVSPAFRLTADGVQKKELGPAAHVLGGQRPDDRPQRSERVVPTVAERPE